jgi:peptidoglycan/LPS O-acetylase OafA/YrhL
MGLAVLVAWRESGAAIPRAVQVATSPAVLWGAWLAILLTALIGLQEPHIGAGGAVPAGPARYLVEQVVYVAVGVLLAAPVLAGTAPHAMRHFLEHRLLVFLGTISYGVFLWHNFVLDILRRWVLDGGASYPVFVALCIPPTVLLAWLSWQFVEAPAIAWSRRLTRRPEPEAVPAVAVA